MVTDRLAEIRADLEVGKGDLDAIRWLLEEVERLADDGKVIASTHRTQERVIDDLRSQLRSAKGAHDTAVRQKAALRSKLDKVREQAAFMPDVWRNPLLKLLEE